MANIFGAPKAGAPTGPDEARTVPKGDVVGSYSSYLDAQKAVDYLADQQFPVQMVSIVGNELKMVERVTGRLSYPRVALSGALSGMWFGLFVGVMLSFFSPTGGYFSIITSVLMGAAFFMLFGIVTYAMQRGKRDFTSTSQVVATSYDVVVSFEAAHEARRLLHQLPMTQSAGATAVQGGYQPDYRSPTPPQGQPQPGPQGHTPQRPAAWNDPYGQRSPESGNQPAGEHQGGAPEDRTPGTDEPAARPAGRVSGVTYPDLPDGRPQYGVRVSEGEKQDPPEDGQQR
ncbi:MULTISPECIES: general stress protein [Arthrobacter]|uniref:ECF transporter S component n=1 Tax=Arthrobacter oryzae TaxID=409290 RepID=A0A3N0BVF0_9MICC|nr:MULTISPECIES: general stress protein [Arthrobacter]QYF89625.1 ECF transporter S component [Arthrobacter sp. PAMC25284]RNL53299.1 ECF transporter S component [Arthrobacter oryzae]